MAFAGIVGASQMWRSTSLFAKRASTERASSSLVKNGSMSVLRATSRETKGTTLANKSPRVVFHSNKSVRFLSERLSVCHDGMRLSVVQRTRSNSNDSNSGRYASDAIHASRGILLSSFDAV